MGYSRCEVSVWDALAFVVFSSSVVKCSMVLSVTSILVAVRAVVLVV